MKNFRISQSILSRWHRIAGVIQFFVKKVGVASEKTICLLLCLVLLLGCGTTALAEEDPGLQTAETLHALGLFRGTGEDENGVPIYALEKTATRAEALVMLIRLLGEEDAALSSLAAHPFTDVPAWADRYVAYAYEKA